MDHQNLITKIDLCQTGFSNIIDTLVNIFRLVEDATNLKKIKKKLKVNILGGRDDFSNFILIMIFKNQEYINL